ncbi:likely ferric reductase [Pseudozyma hubeiensis SY62]|uniref:Likely ferric reductase n=1 Tax=Pseudozyma hubeiensis (strain SY62) TaxID=1305764 RepID=R9P042_PSEHS|nr:likely ferric reductase [Pseudozyma hubeiensis SY62]GAC94347.1 likely ferric reductase [Pseudozyma hubeiensis SY62]
MIPNPWTMSPEALEYIDTLPPDEQGPSLVAYQSYYYNSMKVPCLAAFAMYGLFVVLILAAAFNNLLAWAAQSLHNHLKHKLRLFRAYLWEHPLLSRKHATVVTLPGLRWLTLHLPLRGEGMVISGLFFVNFLPLVAFYKLLEPIAGSTSIDSKSAQICRALADRTGVLGAAQLPLLVLMASKRTPLAIVSGLGQNSLMLYHRWIARCFWAHIFIHAVAYTVVYAAYPDGVKEMLAETYIRWGIVGLAMGFGLIILSLRTLRERHYEVFVMLHILMAVFAILGTYLHIALIDYGPLQAYGVDADYTRLRISVPASKLRFADQPPTLFRGVAAGDDVRITIPRLQWVGEHPFTVFATGISKEDPSRGNIDLLIKTEGGLTRKLAHHAVKSNKTNDVDKDIEKIDAFADQPSIAILIEGPFGTAPEIGESTTELVLVAGGIGITFCWPLFVAAFTSCLSAVDKSSLNSCKLVWIVRHESTLTLLAEAFDDLVQQAQDEQRLKGCRFSMDVFVTSATTAALPDPVALGLIKKEESSTAQDGEISTPRSEFELTDKVAVLPVLSHVADEIDDNKGQEKLFRGGVEGDLVKVFRFHGRPRSLSSSLFGHLDERLLARKHDRTLKVAFCGPSSLCDDVRYETIGLLKRGVNVELVEECFTW